MTLNSALGVVVIVVGSAAGREIIQDAFNIQKEWVKAEIFFSFFLFIILHLPTS